eukprot:357645-Chlamydomonas_euryale.AAC.9
MEPCHGTAHGLDRRVPPKHTVQPNSRMQRAKPWNETQSGGQSDADHEGHSKMPRKRHEGHSKMLWKRYEGHLKTGRKDHEGNLNRFHHTTLTHARTSSPKTLSHARTSRPKPPTSNNARN